MPLSKKRDAERKKVARREARGIGRVLPGDRGRPYQHVVTKGDVRAMNGGIKDATIRWSNEFLSNLRFPARPTYLVEDKVVEPSTGVVLGQIGLEAQVHKLESLVRLLEDRVASLSYAVAELQAEQLGTDAAWNAEMGEELTFPPEYGNS